MVTEDTGQPVLRRVTTGKLRSIKSNLSPAGCGWTKRPASYGRLTEAFL